MQNKLNVILYGSTGFIGSGVLYECLKHPQIEKITVINRKPLEVKNEKIKEIILSDFLDYSQIKDKLTGHNACFYCLGVSQTKVPLKNKYIKITYDYAMAAAKAISEVNQNLTFCFLSGAGTDPSEKSKMMWSRVKGKTEKDLDNLHFKKVYKFRPGMVFPSHGQKPSIWITKMAAPLLPLLNKITPDFVTTTEEFGLAMINVAINGYEKSILENEDIRKASGLTVKKLEKSDFIKL